MSLLATFYAKIRNAGAAVGHFDAKRTTVSDGSDVVGLEKLLRSTVLASYLQEASGVRIMERNSE